MTFADFGKQKSDWSIRGIIGGVVYIGGAFVVAIVVVVHLLSGREIDFANFDDDAPSLRKTIVRTLAAQAVIGVALGLGLAVLLVTVHHPSVQAKLELPREVTR